MKRLTSILTVGALALTGAAAASEPDTIWGIDNANDMLGTFTTDEPGVFDTIGATGITDGFVNSIEFDSQGTLYASSSVTLYTLDRDTGAATEVGPHNISNGETISDMSFDESTGTMYGIGTICGTQSSVYTIDLATGEADFLCTTDLSGSCDVGLTFDGQGNLFGHDIVNDVIHTIDLDDCSTSTLVSLDFDSNFGQGLTANPNTGQAYHIAFNNDAFAGELYAFDEFGNFFFLGELGPLQIGGGDVEVDAAACLDMTIDNLVGGETAFFTVTGGQPGNRTAVLWGTGGSPSVFQDVNGWCATFGFDVKLKNREVRIVGSNVFDANGESVMQRQIRSEHSGLEILFQAAERGTCPGECMSEVVSETIG